MSPALADNNPLNFCAANGAIFALTAVNPEMILEITATVDPIYAGPVASDALL